MNKQLIILFTTIFSLVFAAVFSETTSIQDINKRPASSLGFVENKGQLTDTENNPRPDLLYFADVNSGNVYLGKNFISHVLLKYDGFSEESQEKMKAMGLDTTPIMNSHRVDMEFVGANKNPVINKLNPSEGYNNYYYAHCPNGILNVKSYGRLIYKNVYPNIDIIYYGNFSDGLKYDFVLNPGANPAHIRIKIKGANSVNVNADNSLSIATSLGNINENLPRVYVKDGDKIKDVECLYTVNENVVTFSIGKYDRSKTLIIDPNVWATYFGGSRIDIAQEIVADKNGNVISCGTTGSIDFPSTTGAFQVTLNNAVNLTDGVVVKFDPDGRLIWATYYGSTMFDTFISLATDPFSDDVVIIGHTRRPDFPIDLSTAPYQPTISGLEDIVIIKLDAGGARKWATFYGGSARDYAQDIAVDANGDVVFVGETKSVNLPLLNAFQNTYGGGTAALGDAFVAKLSAAGTTLIFASYYGDGGPEVAHSVAVDGMNNILFAGTTESNSIAPANTPGLQPVNAGAQDGFIIKLSPSGNPIWGRYYGTARADGIYDVKINSANDIVVAGSTHLTVAPIPSLFVIKFSGATGTTLWNYFPTNSIAVNQCSIHCAIDKDDNVYIYSESEAIDAGISPAGCAYQTSSLPNEDDQLYIIKLDNNGNLLCSSFWHLQGHDELGSNYNPNNYIDFGGGGIACYGAYIYTLSTMDTGSPPVTPGAHQPANKGMRDFVISKLCGLSCVGIPSFNTAVSSSVTQTCIGFPVNYTALFTTCDTNGTKYVWSFPGATVSTSTDKNPANIIYPVSGKYDVTLIVETPCGNDTVTYDDYMEINGPAVVLDNINHATCFGTTTGSASVTVTGGSGNINYVWAPAVTGTDNISNLAAGTYSLTVSDGSGCSSQLSVTITEPPLLRAFIPSQVNVSCSGDLSGQASGAALGGTLPYTYLWSNGHTGLIASNLGAGSIQFSVTDFNGCNASVTTIITEPDPLIINSSNVLDLLCYNDGSGQITISASGGVAPYIYFWNTGGTDTTINNLQAGDYTVTVTDQYNCVTTTSVTVTEPLPLLPSIISTQNETCSGKNDGLIQTNVTGGTGAYTYTWSNAGSAASLSNLSAGIYTLTVSDANNCSSIIQSTIVAAVAITFTTTSSPALCFGDNSGNASVTISGGTPGYSYSWSNNNTTENINNVPAGIYTLTVNDDNGCNIIIPVTISQPLQLILLHSPSTSICEGQNYSITSSASGGTPAYIYNWSTGHAGQNISVSPTQQSVYTLTVTDNNNCTVIDSVTVLVNQLPVVSFSVNKQEACAPACFTFTNTTLSTQSVMWNLGSGLSQSGNVITQCYTAEGTYGVTLIVTDDNGCSNTLTENNYLQIFPVPTAAFSASPQSTTILDATINFTNRSQNYTSSNWIFGNNDAISTENNPAYAYPDSGNYTVQLIVINEFGCADTITDFIRIDPDFVIYLPNTFTPNEDGINDVFIPQGEGITVTQYEFLVYDRWGNLIFKTNDPLTGWDGKTVNGQVQIDTYVWKINCIGVTGEKIRRVGHVNVIR